MLRKEPRRTTRNVVNIFPKRHFLDRKTAKIRTQHAEISNAARQVAQLGTLRFPTWHAVLLLPAPVFDPPGMLFYIMGHAKSLRMRRQPHSKNSRSFRPRHAEAANSPFSEGLFYVKIMTKSPSADCCMEHRHCWCAEPSGSLWSFPLRELLPVSGSRRAPSGRP